MKTNLPTHPEEEKILFLLRNNLQLADDLWLLHSKEVAQVIKKWHEMGKTKGFCAETLNWDGKRATVIYVDPDLDDDSYINAFNDLYYLYCCDKLVRQCVDPLNSGHIPPLMKFVVEIICKKFR